jgi:predicted DNA-binding protein YlxM (UPF0122 family)
MKKYQDIFKKVVALRKKGFSLREISEKFGISRSTASMWVKNVQMSLAAKHRILEIQKKGRRKGADISHRRSEEKNVKIENAVTRSLPSMQFTQEQCKGLCAILYGCEGSKRESGRVVFINSDPNLIRFFLLLFRRSFSLKENKFRALVHLHDYHDNKTQVQFWSKVTGIPQGQFTKSYQKINGGKNTREGYQGCVSVRYSDVNIKKELTLLYAKIIAKENQMIVIGG